MPQRGHRARLSALLFVFLVPLAIGGLALLLGQDANWDLRNYHWYNAYAFLNGRYGFDLLPSQTPYFYNPTLDVPFYLLATHVPAMAAAFILGCVQGLNAVLLFMLAYVSLIIPNPRHKVGVCSALALLGMLGGGGIALIGTTFDDNLTSIGLIAALVLIVRNYERLLNAPLRQAFGIAVLPGFLAGAMMGLKLPSVIFCVGMCAAFLLVAGGLQRRVLIGFAFGIGVLIGMALTLGHWMWFLQTHFGSPLFPYFNEIFKSPLAPLTSANDVTFIPRSAHDRLLFPYIFAASPYRVGEIPWRDWRVPILYALLPLALVLRLSFGRAKTSPGTLAAPYAQRYLLWMAVIAYAIWLVMFAVYRYMVLLEMLAPLLIVFAVGMLPLKLTTRGLIAAFVLAIVVFSVQPGNWHRRTDWLDHFIEAQIPPLGDTSNTMILMAGFEPYAHIVTQFPPEIPFVRIQSNFTGPDQDKGMNRLIHERVDAHRGRFLMLIPPWEKDKAQAALAFFHLTLGPEACQYVTDRLFDDKQLALCPVIRITP